MTANGSAIADDDFNFANGTLAFDLATVIVLLVSPEGAGVIRNDDK